MELWSGVIGAALSAVLAALVAVFVVWKTNQHQGKQAAIARADAYAQFEKNLREQRIGLEKQLEHQRMESRRAETMRCLANFVAPVEAVYYSLRGAGDYSDASMEWRHDLHLRMSSAIQELNMVGDYARDAYIVLAGWPEALSSLGHAVNIARAQGLPFEHLEDVLNSACRMLLMAVPDWLSANEEKRSDIAVSLKSLYEATYNVQHDADKHA